MLKIGSCAAKVYKSRQIRKEAAVSKTLWVPQGNLIGVNCFIIAWEGSSRIGRGHLLKEVYQNCRGSINGSIPIYLQKMETSIL